MILSKIKNLLLFCCLLATTLATAQTKAGQFAACRDAQGNVVAGCKIISGADGRYATTTITNTCVNGDLVTDYIDTKTGQSVFTETCEGVCDAANQTLKVCTDFADAAALCAYIAANPNAPIATADCDNAGKNNTQECTDGTDPYNPSDDAGCEELGNLTLFTNPTDVSCAGGSDGQITFNIVSGGVAPWTYAWSNGATTQNLENVPAGNYTVDITDANGCKYIINIASVMTISEPVVIMVACDMTTNESSLGAADGSTSVVVSGGTGPYAYAWSNSATTASITGLSAGNYTVTVTDAENCTKSQTCTIGAGACATISVTASMQTAILCSGASTGAVTATATGGTGTYTYAWSAGPTGLSAGTYSVTATDGNGCTGSDNVTLSQPSALVLNMSCSSETSNNGDNGTATVTSSGGTTPYSYSWQHDSGLTTGNATGLAPGTYGVIVTDGNGCTATAACTVNAFGCSNPSVNLAATSLSCFGANDGAINSIISGGTAPYTYAWSNGATSANITGLTAGNYTLNITDANGCMGSATTSVSSPSMLTATCSSSSESAPNANDGQLTASVGGGTTPYTYAWSNGGTTATITGLAPGNYTANITDQNGCTTSTSCTVSAASCSTITTGLLSIVDVDCNGGNNGSINLTTPTGGTFPYTYAWTGGGTTDPNTTLTAGTYSATITDANGCTATAGPYTVSQPASALSAACSSTNSSNGGSTGSATVVASGGTSPYSYDWSNGGTTATITGLAAGNYSYTVTDNRNCEMTGTCTVGEDAVTCPTLTATLTANQSGDCDGLGDIFLSGFISSGTFPYTYAWTGPNGFTSTAEDLADVVAGAYTVIITDANGCTGTFNTTLVSPINNITGVCSSTNADTNTSNGTATVTPSGGSTPYAYAWSTGATTQTITGLAAGNYSYTVTDAIGCSATGTCTVAENVATCPTLTATLTANQSGDCDGLGDIFLSGFISSGTFPYTYAWTGPNGFTSTAEDLADVVAGAYTVIITDANGCTGTFNTTLVSPINNITGVCSSTNADTNTSNGTATVTPSGGSTPYAYAWSTGATTQTITGLAAGNYSYTVTDAIGCSATGTCTVAENVATCPTLTATLTANQSGDCDGLGDIFLSGFISSGTFPYTQSWTGPNGFTSTEEDLADVVAGTYNLTVTDAVGCTGTFSSTLISSNNLVASCQIFSDNLLLGSATGGITAYTYAWTGPNGFTASQSNIGPLANGTYNLIVTDAENCTATTSCTISVDACANFQAACTVSDDDITSATNNGAAPFTYAWTGPNGYTANTANISSVPVGTYSLIVTDANGCDFTSSCTVEAPGCSANVSGTDDDYTSTCLLEGGSSITVDVKANDSWTCDDVFFMGPSLVTGPINVVNNNDGTFTVTPNTSGCGLATFTYVVSCCNGDEATEKIDVKLCVDCNDSDDVYLTGCMPTKCSATNGDAKLVYNFPQGGATTFITNASNNEIVFLLPSGYTGNDLATPADVIINFGDGTGNVTIADGVSDAGYSPIGTNHTYATDGCYVITYSFTSNSGLDYSYEYQLNVGASGSTVVDAGAAVIQWNNGTGCTVNMTAFEVNGSSNAPIVSVTINGTSLYSNSNPSNSTPGTLNFTIDDSWPINTALPIVVCSQTAVGCTPAGTVCTTQEFMIVCE